MVFLIARKDPWYQKSYRSKSHFYFALKLNQKRRKDEITTTVVAVMKDPLIWYRHVLYDCPLSAQNCIFCTFCTPIWDRTPTRDHQVTTEGAVFRRRDHCIYINVYFEFIIIFIWLFIIIFIWLSSTFFFITFFFHL